MVSFNILAVVKYYIEDGPISCFEKKVLTAKPTFGIIAGSPFFIR
jgi:hypothetical protein